MKIADHVKQLIDMYGDQDVQVVSIVDDGKRMGTFPSAGTGITQMLGMLSYSRAIILRDSLKVPCKGPGDTQ